MAPPFPAGQWTTGPWCTPRSWPRRWAAATATLQIWWTVCEGRASGSWWIRISNLPVTTSHSDQWWTETWCPMTLRSSCSRCDFEHCKVPEFKVIPEYNHDSSLAKVSTVGDICAMSSGGVPELRHPVGGEPGRRAKICRWQWGWGWNFSCFLWLHHIQLCGQPIRIPRWWVSQTHLHYNRSVFALPLLPLNQQCNGKRNCTVHWVVCMQNLSLCKKK